MRERKNGRVPKPADLTLTPAECAVAIEATATAANGHQRLWYGPLERAIIRATLEVPELKPGQLRHILRSALGKVWEKSFGDKALDPEEQIILAQFNRAMALHPIQSITPSRFITLLANRIPVR